MFLIFFGLACKKQEDTNPPGWQYGPGELYRTPGIVAYIDSVPVFYDYQWTRATDYNKESDSTINLSRTNSNSTGSFHLYGGKIILEAIQLPVTFNPNGLYNQPIPWVHVSLTNDNHGYGTLQHDTTQFSVTLTAFHNNLLSGKFRGRLFEGNDTSKFINTSGHFCVPLIVY